jgi:hypothetical protein
MLVRCGIMQPNAQKFNVALGANTFDTLMMLPLDELKDESSQRKFNLYRGVETTLGPSHLGGIQSPARRADSSG